MLAPMAKGTYGVTLSDPPPTSLRKFFEGEGGD
jgi:hypothetical protein